MVSGEWVSDYSKRPAHPLISQLRPPQESDWSFHRYCQTKKEADARKREEMGGQGEARDTEKQRHALRNLSK